MSSRRRRWSSGSSGERTWGKPSWEVRVPPPQLEEWRRVFLQTRTKDARELLRKRMEETGKGRLIGPDPEKVTLGYLGKMLVTDYEGGEGHQPLQEKDLRESGGGGTRTPKGLRPPHFEGSTRVSQRGYHPANVAPLRQRRGPLPEHVCRLLRGRSSPSRHSSATPAGCSGRSEEPTAGSGWTSVTKTRHIPHLVGGIRIQINRHPAELLGEDNASLQRLVLKSMAGQTEVFAREREAFYRRLRELQKAYELWQYCERPSSSESELEASRLLADSIRYRLDALLFHWDLLQGTFESAKVDHLHDSQSVRRQLLRSVAARLQYLFDDLVFNAISLFDYLGCFVGLVVEGVGSHKIDWSKGVGKAKAAGSTSALASAMKGADQPFVSTLLRYRSELSHFRRDKVDGSITIDLSRTGGGDLHVTLPQAFAQTVRRSKGSGETWNEDTAIVEAAAAVIFDAVQAGGTVLAALRAHVDGHVVTGPAEDTTMLMFRWSRDGIFDEVAEDLQADGSAIDGLGAILHGSSLTLVVHLTQEESVEGGSRDLREFLPSVPTRGK